MKGLQRSFAGGEIAPEMFGRLDLGKFQTGLQLCLNFRTLAHGPATRRPGFLYVNEVKDSTRQARLIPFVFSATQAVMIELGHLTARFHNSSGTVLEADKSISAVTLATPGVFTTAAHGYATGDGVYLANLGGMPTLGGRFYTVVVLSANTFSLNTLAGVAVSTAALAAYTGGGTVARVYTLTTPWANSDLFTLTYTQSADVLTIASTKYPTSEMRRTGSISWSIATVSFTPTLASPTGVTCTAVKPTPTNVTTQSYVVTALGADGITESLASTAASDTNNLNIAGNLNVIAWTAVAGATRYYVYKLRGGSYGYIGQTTALTINDDNILPDGLQTPPTNSNTLNTGAGDYPGAVAYHEQRRWFAGTLNQPQNVWGTRSATDSNLTSSVPLRDDDAMVFRIASQQQNAIQHLVPLVDMLALTVGGEFRLFADGGPAITPGTLSVKPQGYAGASSVRPVLSAGSALYVQAQGSHILEVTYSPYNSGSYKTDDVSLFAPHLVNGYTMREMAYSRAPDKTLWVVRTDGQMLGLTHVPDQQVYGWHRHTTDGSFESCAVIPEGSEDVLYAIVKRVVNGRTVRFVERMKSRLFTADKDAFYVDAGLSYTGAAATTISGLMHLEGKSVAILADGAVVSGQTVVNGTVTLPLAASTVQVGLPYNSDLQTLPAALEQMPAVGQGTVKNVSKVFLRVTQSSLVKAGPTFDKLTAQPARAVTDPYGSAPALRTGEIGIALTPSWTTDGSVCVRQDQPLPLTVLALTVDTVTGG